MSSVIADDTPVAVQLNFGIDEQQIKFVAGHLEARLKLQCQRCMELFEYEMKCDFALAILDSEKEIKSLPARYEPMIINDGVLSIVDMVEEELIVSLPIVPMHDTENCPVVAAFIAFRFSN